MNIFYLDEDIKKCVEYHCDKHVIKMIIEYAQMLSTAHHVLDINSPIKDKIYKKTHMNHPCAKWVRESSANYNYLYTLLSELCDEYSIRYNKTHKTSELLEYLKNIPLNIPNQPFTSPPQAMPEIYKNNDTVTAYRNYYLGDKKDFATWRNRIPDWWAENQ